MTQHGSFYWNELMTRDVPGSKDFYQKALGWTFEDMPMGDGGTYAIVHSGGQMVGGIFDISGSRFDGAPECWFAYIAVDDLDKRLAMAVKAGGKVLRDPWVVEGVGRMAILSDPAGAMQGWIVPTAEPMR